MMLTDGNQSIGIAQYVAANWTKFYKGQMVRSDVNKYSWGDTTLGLDGQSSNYYQSIVASYALSDIPLNYTNSTIFYMEYKTESTSSTNLGGFSSATANRTLSPIYGVSSIYSINANANPDIVYTEAHPDAGYAYYQSAPNVYETMYPGTATFAMQARSVAVARVPINIKDITEARFYQNSYNDTSSSPSILVMPGYWSTAYDSGATTFTPTIVGGQEWTGDIIGDVMDTTQASEIDVKAGDLIIGTTMLEKHPVDAINPEYVTLVYSWTRNRANQGGHGTSIWFSKVDAIFNISRAINQYPGSRFTVYRYNAAGVAQPLPVVVPPPPPALTGGSSGGYGGFRSNTYNLY